jgi:hypothetical protein
MNHLGFAHHLPCSLPLTVTDIDKPERDRRKTNKWIDRAVGGHNERCTALKIYLQKY